MLRSVVLAVLISGSLAAQPALVISGVSGRDRVELPSKNFSLRDLKGLPRTSVAVKGRDGVERKYTGVRLSELLKRVGHPQGEEVRGPLLSRAIVATGHDGYRVTFSLPELDPAFTAAETIVVDAVDDKPLPDREGPLRLIVPGEKREARWVRMLERIEVVAIEVIR